MNDATEADDDVVFINEVLSHERVPNESQIINLDDDDEEEDEEEEEGIFVEDNEKSKKRPHENGEVDNKEQRQSSLQASAAECPVCMESYTSEGERRCTATKCGHLFCFYCIKTIQKAGGKCPTCRKKLGHQSNLVPIYATNIIAMDATELHKAQSLMEEERTKRVRVETENAIGRQRELELRRTLELLQRQLEQAKRTQVHASSSSSSSSSSLTTAPSSSSSLQQLLQQQQEQQRSHFMPLVPAAAPPSHPPLWQCNVAAGVWPMNPLLSSSTPIDTSSTIEIKGSSRYVVQDSTPILFIRQTPHCPHSLFD